MGRSERSAQPTETRPRRKIREAAEALGLRVEYAHWSPIGTAGEKEGASGGWEVWIDDKHGENVAVVLGYSWREVVESIEQRGGERLA